MKKPTVLIILLFIVVVVVALSSFATGGRVQAETSRSWQQFIDVAGDFAMSGVYVNDKLYLGGYGNGRIYSWHPLTTELDMSGEAILAMVEFKGEIYATSESHDMAGQRTRVLRRTASGWVQSGAIDGYATYFMTVWNGCLIVMATTDLQSTDFWYSDDGVKFHRGHHFKDWLWIPTVFRGELYVLGHSGPAGGPGSSKAVKWTGSEFINVPALCGTPGVKEWQTATEHNGFLFLGAGGWTLARGKSTAAVYRFNGTVTMPVKVDGNYREVQALLSSKFNGYLYASFGGSFKQIGGGSQLWASNDNGETWVNAGLFPGCPNLYVLMDTPYGYVAAGGEQGNLHAYFFDTRGLTPIQPAKKHRCPSCGFEF